MIRKFKVQVSVITDVDVEIDDAQFDAAEMEKFCRDFYGDIDTYEKHAEHIAQFAARFGERDFIEGYGFVKYRGEYSAGVPRQISEGAPAFGINLVVGSEDVETEIL